MVILPNTFYFPNYDDFNQQDQCHQQYPHGQNQYKSLLDIQFHHHCLFSDAFLKPSACLIPGWTFLRFHMFIYIKYLYIIHYNIIENDQWFQHILYELYLLIFNLICPLNLRELSPHFSQSFIVSLSSIINFWLQCPSYDMSTHSFCNTH